MKNEAGYLYPVRSVTLAAAGTFTQNANSTVVRIFCTATTTITFGGSGAVVNLAPNVGEYFRTRPGEVLTAGGACIVTEMT